MITVSNLSKSYGNNKVLQDINITFEKGKVYGIIGENGAGKSTLFRCIAGLEKHSGAINSDFAVLKNHVGFLPTDLYLFPKITGQEYIQLLSNARNIKLENLHERNIFELPLNEYANTYSTGMKKKLALLAILLQKNDIYILDEPFNGVDIQSSILIAEIVHSLKQLQKTVIISSHIFSTLQDTCDEIHLLQNANFVRRVLPDEFPQLEQDMKHFIVGNRVAKLELE